MTNFEVLQEIKEVLDKNPRTFLFLKGHKNLAQEMVAKSALKVTAYGSKKEKSFYVANEYLLNLLNFMEEQTLYTKDSKGRIRAWTIKVAESETEPGILYSDGLVDGKMKDFTFKKSVEKNVGKSNYISAFEQATIMMQQEIAKKIKDNYFYTIVEAENSEIFSPMLAEKYDIKHVTFPVLMQPKLDGARCNVIFKENSFILNSRSNTEFVSCPHILESLKDVLREDIILDGELYNHAYKDRFEDLMSLIRTVKCNEEIYKATLNVQYHIYDIYFKNKPLLSNYERVGILKSLALVFKDHPYIKIVDTFTVETLEHIDLLHDKFIEEGYEGSMIRNTEGVYAVSLRSKNLLKKKDFMDDEFEIVDILEGEAAWAGKAKRVVIKLPDGRENECGLRGNFEQAEKLLQNKESYIGKKATVTYFGVTNDGKLRMPVIKDINRTH
jgi:DNA ligase 1